MSRTPLHPISMGFLVTGMALAVTAPAQAAEPTRDLQRALACEAGAETLPILRRHGVPINGERHALKPPVVIYGVQATAVFVTQDRNDVNLYVEVPMRQKRALAKAAGMRHVEDDESAVFTKRLPSGATLTIDDISDEGEMAMLECRI